MKRLPVPRLGYGSTGDTSATEDTPLNPVEMVRWRQALEREILAAGVEASIRSLSGLPGYMATGAAPR